jgi:hypothetical protein
MLPGHALQMALHGRGLFAFAFLGRLLIELPTTKLGQYTRFLTGTFEPPQGGIEVLVFLYANTRHTDSFFSSNK